MVSLTLPCLVKRKVMKSTFFCLFFDSTDHPWAVIKHFFLLVSQRVHGDNTLSIFQHTSESMPFLCRLMSSNMKKGLRIDAANLCHFFTPQIA